MTFTDGHGADLFTADEAAKLLRQSSRTIRRLGKKYGFARQVSERGVRYDAVTVRRIAYEGVDFLLKEGAQNERAVT